MIPVYQYYKEFVEWERLCNATTNNKDESSEGESSNRMNISSDEPDIEINKLALIDNNVNEVTEAKEEIIVSQTDVVSTKPDSSTDDAITEINDDDLDLDTRENEDM